MLRTKHLIVAIAFSLLVAIGGRAQAAVVTEASAEIDWASLTIATSGSLVVSTFEVLDIVNAFGNFVFDTNLPAGTAPSVGASVSAVSAGGTASATATTDALADPGGLSAVADTSTPSPNPGDEGNAEAFRVMGLSADSGNGRATISVDFTLDVSVFASAGIPATALAEVALGEVVFNLSGSISWPDQTLDFLVAQNLGADVVDTITGTLSWRTDPLSGGDSLFFGAYAQAEARNTLIPLPASIYFLGSALAALVTVRRGVA